MRLNQQKNIKMKFKYLSVLLFAITITLQTHGYIIPRNEIYVFDTNMNNKLCFYFFNGNYFINNEYFSPVAQGYTLTGYFANPQMRYYFTDNLRVDAGLHLLKYTGKTKFSKIQPVYSASYNKNGVSLILGNLNSTLFHNLPDQIYNRELFFTNNIETGAQIIVDKHNFFGEFWADWQQFIEPNDSIQEKFISGIMLEPKLFFHNDVKLSVPIALLAQHTGGQIDTSRLPVNTAINFLYGINFTIDTKLKYLNSVQIGATSMHFSDNSNFTNRIYKSGFGFLTHVRLNHKLSYVEFGHWYSDRFLSIAGNQLYQSFSMLQGMQHQEKRHLITLNGNYNYKLTKGVFVGAMANLYYDLRLKQTEYNFGVSIVINREFFVTTIK